MKILKIDAKVFVVNQNEDDSLTIIAYGLPLKNPEKFIRKHGGRDEILAQCVEVTEEEWKAYLKMQREGKKMKQEERQRQIAENKALIRAAYHEVFDGVSVVEATPYNIFLLLYFLNMQNWGTWELPNMTVSYTCGQYDCDGIQVTTIVLDKPIPYDGEMESRFKTGGPRGSLPNYRTLGFTFYARGELAQRFENKKQKNES